MKIAIAGYGVEGRASYDYWNSSDNELTVADERDHVADLPADVRTVLGADAFSKLTGFDLIIRSPSVNPKKLPYPGKVWSATNEFLAKCPAPIIGVTGTKGKGTTCSLIASILRAAGRSVHLVGNIGTPALAELPKIKADDIVVYEMSSFQLWDLEKSPHIAVVLMIEPDHLDIHDSLIDYIGAKTRIVADQTSKDMVVFNKDNRAATAIGEVSRARKVMYPFDVSEFADSLKLPGRHNQENASAAIAAVGEYTIDPEAIRNGLAAFNGLPHRLNMVAEKDGVKYYDDSIATTAGSALAAVNSFDEPIVLLLGGHEKGSDYAELMKRCAEKDVRVIAYGANRQVLKTLCDQHDVSCSVNDGDMGSVVTEAAALAKSDGVVILSPAAASFDMFKNYADRGDQFIAAVNALA